MTVCLDLSNEIEYLNPSISAEVWLGGFMASLLSRLDGRLGKQARRWRKQTNLFASDFSYREKGFNASRKQASKIRANCI